MWSMCFADFEFLLSTLVNTKMSLSMSNSIELTGRPLVNYLRSSFDHHRVSHDTCRGVS